MCNCVGCLDITDKLTPLIRVASPPAVDTASMMAPVLSTVLILAVTMFAGSVSLKAVEYGVMLGSDYSDRRACIGSRWEAFQAG